MGDSCVRNAVHIIFATAGRRPYLRDDALRSRLWHYMGGCFRAVDAQPIVIGGWIDHAHAAVYAPPTRALADVVREAKKSTSRWLGEQPECRGGFSWQRGYAAMSVSHSHLAALRKYIEGQEAHHQAKDLGEEWARILAQHGITEEWSTLD